MRLLPNTVFVVHFVRPNWFTPTSQTPIPLDDTPTRKEEKDD
jgi:hypothetical protein